VANYSWLSSKSAAHAPLSLKFARLPEIAPRADGYLLPAEESGQSRALRGFLEEQWQLEADSLKTAGYWERGVADCQD